MRKLLFTILLINQIIYSQKKEIIVFDNKTKLPINQVQVFYKQINEGSITNKNGKTEIFIKNKDLSIMHIN